MGDTKFIIINGEKGIKGEYTYDEIHKMFTPYVRKQAHSYYGYLKSKFSEKWSSMVSVDDLISCGFFGLYKSYKMYDADKKISFSHYMKFSVNGQISKCSEQTLQLRRLNKGKDVFMFALNGDEVMHEDDGSPITLFDVIGDDSQDTEGAAIASIGIKEALKCLEKINKSYWDIIVMRISGFSQSEISKKYNISQVQVSRKESKAREIMKDFLLKGEINMPKKPGFERKVDRENLDEFFMCYGITTETIKAYADKADIAISTVKNYISTRRLRSRVKPPFKELEDKKQDKISVTSNLDHTLHNKDIADSNTDNKEKAISNKTSLKLNSLVMENDDGRRFHINVYTKTVYITDLLMKITDVELKIDDIKSLVTELNEVVYLLENNGGVK